MTTITEMIEKFKERCENNPKFQEIKELLKEMADEEQVKKEEAQAKFAQMLQTRMNVQEETKSE